MGKASRIKGRAYEQSIARFLRRLDPTARRLLEFQGGMKTVSTGSDIQFDNILMSLQCKHRRIPNPWKALEEAEKGRKDKRELAVAFVKKTRKGEIVCMRKNEWILMAEAYFNSLKPIHTVYIGDKKYG